MLEELIQSVSNDVLAIFQTPGEFSFTARSGDVFPIDAPVAVKMEKKVGTDPLTRMTVFRNAYTLAFARTTEQHLIDVSGGELQHGIITKVSDGITERFQLADKDISNDAGITTYDAIKL
jgi:hypothetical protein